MTPIFNVLLGIHITAGFTAISAAFSALLTEKGKHLHRVSGRIFLYAMFFIVATAIPMCIIKANLFLFLIALFSYYFALSGYLFATNRSGMASTFAWAITGIMFCVSLGMMAYSISHLHSQDDQNVILLIFGIIGCLTSTGDFKTYYTDEAIGNFRIIKHLSAMLGATIAVITAFTVVNIQTNPVYLAWITPTLVILPVIAYWQRRVKNWPDKQ